MSEEDNKGFDTELINQLTSGLEKLNAMLKLADENENVKKDLVNTKAKMREPLSEVEKTRAELEETRRLLEQERAAKDTTVNQYRNQYEELTKTTHIREALNKNNAYTELLEPHLKSRVKIVEHEGVQKVVVTDSLGNIVKRANGELAEVSDLVEEFKQNAAYSVAFKSNKTTGSGLTGGSFSNNSVVNENNPFVTGNRTQQNELIRKDPALAEKLKAQAKKT